MKAPGAEWDIAFRRAARESAGPELIVSDSIREPKPAFTAVPRRWDDHSAQASGADYKKWAVQRRFNRPLLEEILAARASSKDTGSRGLCAARDCAIEEG